MSCPFDAPPCRFVAFDRLVMTGCPAPGGMMRSWVLLVLVLVPPTTAVASGVPVDRNAERVRPGPLERDTQRITFRRFGLQLLAEALARAPADSNRVLSPASAGMALSLVMAGARGSPRSPLRTRPRTRRPP